MPLPDFLIIGAPKAGTTALHAALATHPGLYMSPVKEPKFFLTDGPPPSRGGGPGDIPTWREHVWRREDYEALFAEATAGQLRAESTPFYLYDGAAQRRIRGLIPDVRMIAMLRDPVERAHSNWAHLWSAGLDPIGDFVRACADEDRRVAAGWAQFWHYTRLGRYGEQLEHLYQVFPMEQVLVLRYRDLVDAPGPDAGPDLRVPRGRAGRRHRGTPGERDRAPGRVAGPPGRFLGDPRGRGGEQAPAGYHRHGPDQPAGTDAAARRPPAPAPDLGAAAGGAAVLRV